MTDSTAPGTASTGTLPTKPGKPASGSIRTYIIVGMLLIVLLVGGLGGWAVTARISGAVTASGRVVVESSVKKVQHREGGIVEEIFVRDGDAVEAGQVLIRLRKTQEQANLNYVEKQWIEYRAKSARLRAERDGEAELLFDIELSDLANPKAAREAIDGERKLFRARRSTRLGQIAQFRQRISQSEQQIAGLKAQRVKNKEQIHYVDEQIDDQEQLAKKGLGRRPTLLGLKRDRARLDGADSQLVAQIAVVQDKISETRLQILQVEKDFLENVLKELNEVETRLTGFRNQRITALDRLKRMEIVAPTAGTVHELQVHTVGGVIGAGEPVLHIVPKGDRLIVEANIAPVDIDQVKKGKVARINFSAFNLRETKQIYGKVIGVSADQIKDARTGVGYYTVRIEVDEASLATLGDHKIVPGMPADISIQTRPRLAIYYWLEPLLDHLDATFGGTFAGEEADDPAPKAGDKPGPATSDAKKPAKHS